MGKRVPRESDAARLYLLGGFRLEVPVGRRGRVKPVEIPSLKGRALVAYLAMARGKCISREQLSLLLWGEGRSGQARRNLRQEIFKLNRLFDALNLELLDTDGHGLCLRPNAVRADVWQFESLVAQGAPAALAQAAELYAGEFLRNLVPEAPVYGEWLSEQRAAFEDQALVCLSAVTETQIGSGDWSGAVASAHRALRVDSCHMAAHHSLMRLYSSAGMIDAALAQYRAYRAVLRRELDAEPDEAAQELYRRLNKKAAAPIKDSEAAPGDLTLDAAASEEVLPCLRPREVPQALANLSPGARAMIQLASLTVEPFGLRVLALAAQVDLADADAKLQELGGAGWLQGNASALGFRRAWLADAIRDGLPVSRRTGLHAAIAGALRQDEAAGGEPNFTALVRHCKAAGQSLAALRYQISACELQVQQGESAAALRTLDRLARDFEALRPSSDVEFLWWRAGLIRASLAEAAGDSATQLTVLRQLERSRPGALSAAAEAEFYYALSRAVTVTGARDEGMAYTRRALGFAARTGGLGSPWYLAERLLFRLHLFAPNLQGTGRTLSERAKTAEERGMWRTASELLATKAMVDGLQDQCACARASLGTVQGLAAKLKDPRLQMGLLQVEGMTLLLAKDGQTALDRFDRALALARLGGDTIRICVLQGLRGRARLMLRRLPEARQDLDDAAALAGELTQVPYLPVFFAWLAEVAFRQGRSGPGAGYAERARRLERKRPRAWSRPAILRAQALACAHATPPAVKDAARAAQQARAAKYSLGLPPNPAAERMALSDCLTNAPAF